MKKTIIIIITIAAVAGIIAGGTAFYINSDYHNEYIDNYISNFKDNIFNLRLRYELKKAEREEDAESSPETEEAEQTDAEAVIPEESAEPEEKDSEQETTTNSTKQLNENELPQIFALSCDPIALKGAANAKFSRYQDGILCVVENSINCYNNKGEKKWSAPIQISNPILKVAEPYILLMEQGGKKICVFNNEKVIYEAQTDEKILTGNISSNGECVAVTEKKYYKGAVSVYNKSGEEIYSRSFGSESVISAAISNSRKLAVSLLNITNKPISKISFLDVSKTEADVEVTYENTIIYDLDFSQNTLYAYADDKMIALNSNGKEQWVNNFESKTLNRYRKDSGDVRLLLFDNNNNAELAIVNSSGKERQKISTDIIPNNCDICDGYVIFSNERNLFLTRMNGNYLAKYTPSRDIQKAYFIDSDNIMIVYNSSIEFIHTQKNKK